MPLEYYNERNVAIQAKVLTNNEAQYTVSSPTLHNRIASSTNRYQHQDSTMTLCYEKEPGENGEKVGCQLSTYVQQKKTQNQLNQARN